MSNILKICFALLICASAHSAPFRITATSWLVADSAGKIVQGQNTQKVRSIASITKLMTAMVVLDSGIDLNEKLGTYSRMELIELALVKSDNKAAETLCDTYPGGKQACVFKMNLKAHELGMDDTHYVESTGLSVFNVSTAEDLVKLVMAAEKYPVITKAAKTPQVKIKLRKKWLFFNNTNPIIGKRYDFVVSKTGFINAAGGCIALMVDTDVGRKIVVVLGSKNTRTRIPEAEFIIKNY
jgi:D-alanyl-D-alanine endopeptidase (penicillin-binding protein 7)